MIAKFPYIRSKALMTLYRSIPCQSCGRDDGSVCGAHSNMSIHGHGRSVKSSDEYAASLCSTCHYELDQGKSLTRKEKQLMWSLAHAKTVKRLGVRYHAIVDRERAK